MPKAAKKSDDNRSILEYALGHLEREAAEIQEKIDRVKRQLGQSVKSAAPAVASVAGPAPAAPASAAPKKRVLSAAARKRIAAAQKKRWAEHRKAKATTKAPAKTAAAKG
jgi:hypothetical protein